MRTGAERAARRRRVGVGAVVAISATLFSGCGLGGLQEQSYHEADPAFVMRVLPTRPGLTPTGPERTIGIAEYPRAVLGRDDPALTAGLPGAGFRSAATRDWTGPNGALLSATAALWDDGTAAGSLGGAAARAVVPNGDAWTPAGYGGAQGYRAANARALSVIVGRVSLFVRTEGPVDDSAVLRTIDLMRQAAAGEDREGTSSNG
ncbi:MAG: hypothetical protein EXQ74_02250 [Thermoleophilia bacterium]|nr:hypothetical protein [Thermoleophilia bacterium]